MKSLVLIVALILAAGLAGPTTAEARAPSEKSKWGAMFRTDLVLETDPGCRQCDLGETQFTQSRVGVNPTRNGSPIRFASIRVTNWKKEPGGRYSKYQRRTWRDVVVRPRTKPTPWRYLTTPERVGNCDEPLGTRYFSRVRIKRAGKPALWLRGETETLVKPWCSAAP